MRIVTALFLLMLGCIHGVVVGMQEENLQWDMYCAIKEGDVKKAQVIDKGLDIQSKVGDLFQCLRLRVPIEMAIENKQLPIVKLLLQNGAQITDKCFNLSSMCRYVQFTWFCIRSNDVDLRMYRLLFTYMACASDYHIKEYKEYCINSLVNCDEKRPQWVRFVLQFLRLLMNFNSSLKDLEVGKDYDEQSYNPLHLLAEKNELEAIKIVLFHGADITITDHEGKTAYDKATDPVVKKLLAIEPKDLDTYSKNPVLYVQEHADEFNPVNRYPKEFAEECKLFEQEQKEQAAIGIELLVKKHGSISKYLKSRELGLAI